MGGFSQPYILAGGIFGSAPLAAEFCLSLLHQFLDLSCGCRNIHFDRCADGKLSVYQSRTVGSGRIIKV